MSCLTAWRATRASGTGPWSRARCSPHRRASPPPAGGEEPQPRGWRSAGALHASGPGPGRRLPGRPGWRQGLRPPPPLCPRPRAPSVQPRRRDLSARGPGTAARSLARAASPPRRGPLQRRRCGHGPQPAAPGRRTPWAAWTLSTFGRPAAPACGTRRGSPRGRPWLRGSRTSLGAPAQGLPSAVHRGTCPPPVPCSPTCRCWTRHCAPDVATGHNMRPRGSSRGTSPSDALHARSRRHRQPSPAPRGPRGAARGHDPRRPMCSAHRGLHPQWKSCTVSVGGRPATSPGRAPSGRRCRRLRCTGCTKGQYSACTCRRSARRTAA
mmetsp:Transcript_101408/g.302440  ORF Transcript_101408/g.302440 Transcript_101408/m.302440 type:complete len:324 (-) Transcript_101408:109-1080(-)